MAGSINCGHGSRPCSSHARNKPATVPGTPTARWLWWWTFGSYTPSFMNIVGDAPAGAISRKSYAVGSPLAGRNTRNPPPPMLPAVGCVTASAKAVAMAASTALPPRRRMSAPISDARPLADTTMPFVARTGCELAPSGMSAGRRRRAAARRTAEAAGARRPSRTGSLKHGADNRAESATATSAHRARPPPAPSRAGSCRRGSSRRWPRNSRA